MNNSSLISKLKLLLSYVEKEEFQGYDPYDTLNSKLPFKHLGSNFPSIAIQIQKRNPVNIRPLLGIKKGYNPKGMGLFLKTYCKLYLLTGEPGYLEKANLLFEWLYNNSSSGFSGTCWGYNFDWASPGSYLPAYTPSVVVTSFVSDGIFEYYNITGNPKAKTVLLSAAEYICNDIPLTEFKQGISFSYTHIEKDCCYNASLLAAEVLAKADYVNKTSKWSSIVNLAIDFVLSRQKENGEWYYSYDLKTGEERRQIDFHQGFILVSLFNLINLYGPRDDVFSSISHGLSFYKKYQFNEDGSSLWRVPKKWPIDIHNQSQGIITFSKLNKYHPDYLSFANHISDWTIKTMQSGRGYFYYRKNWLFVNRISYMRWAQGWMALALSELINNNESK